MVISDLLMWKPYFQNKRGRKLTYLDVISRDVGLKQEDLKTAMMDCNDDDDDDDFVTKKGQDESRNEGREALKK